MSFFLTAKFSLLQQNFLGAGRAAAHTQARTHMKAHTQKRKGEKHLLSHVGRSLVHFAVLCSQVSLFAPFSVYPSLHSNRTVLPPVNSLPCLNPFSGVPGS